MAASGGCCSCAAFQAFLNGPDFISITSEEVDVESALQRSLAAVAEEEQISGEPVVEVVLEPVKPEAAPHKHGKPPAELASAAYRCTSALGTQFSGKSIENFDKNRQVYSKKDLSPLPFQPPVFYTYLIAMLSGSFKVFQYVVTVMVALMVTQNALERYWSMQDDISAFQAMLFVIFLSYPMLTLLLVVLTNNEMVVRRLIYYRLMSLQVIVDWENTPFYKMWFFYYFCATFVIINVYSLYVGVITKDDKTTSVLPQWSIMVMQSMLLFMFWLTIISMEDGLVPLNKVIENSPKSAKELITKCDVVTESQLKAAIRGVNKRKKQFKRLTAAEQQAAAEELFTNGHSAAAFFDLLQLRKTGKNRVSQDEAEAAADEPANSSAGCCSCLTRLAKFVDDTTYGKLYAFLFCFSFLAYYFSRTMRRVTRPGRSFASVWPYEADFKYFVAMALLGSSCTMLIIAVEGYAIWFTLFATDIADRNKYGVLECKQCYSYHVSAGETCISKAAADPCWGAAKLGFCAMQDALLHKYNMNITQLARLNPDKGCMGFLPAV